MGNANSQMLENIVQGSNCEFFLTKEPFPKPGVLHRSQRNSPLTKAFSHSRPRRSRQATKAFHETGQSAPLHLPLTRKQYTPSHTILTTPPHQDGSGTIEREEFLQLPQVSSNPLATRMIAIFDEDGGGDVDFQEFVSGLSAFSSKGNKEEKLRFAFKVYDIDRDGYISNGELFIVLKMMVGSNLKDQQLQQVSLLGFGFGLWREVDRETGFGWRDLRTYNC
jgi:hypothetical protein